MTVRYSDLEEDNASLRDFMPRKRFPSVAHLILILLLTTAIVVTLLVSIGDKTVLALTLIGMLCIIGGYVIIQLLRNHDLLLATEFQNALFASALGLNNKFCLIIRRNGNIVYLDRMFQEMFPDFLQQPQRSIDALLDRGKVTRQDADKIFAAIEHGVYEKVVFEIKGADGKFVKVIMSIEPIMRPSGFILLRGREFVEARTPMHSDKLKPSSIMNKHTITLFSHVMDTMNMGIYMTAPDGNLVYANPVIEQWLGYSEGEITTQNFAIQDLIHQNGARPDHVAPENFEGEVTMKKKTGGLLRSFINQKIIRDEHDKIVGCTAVVHHFSEQNNTTQNKLW